jgi:hypothetical protein
MRDVTSVNPVDGVGALSWSTRPPTTPRRSGYDGFVAFFKTEGDEKVTFLPGLSPTTRTQAHRGRGRGRGRGRESVNTVTAVNSAERERGQLPGTCRSMIVLIRSTEMPSPPSGR